MKVAVIGSRDCGAFDYRRILAHLPEGCTEIISGGARGIDTCAERAAGEAGIAFVKIEPDYARYGRQAPMLRNLEIVRRADLVLAFWDYRSRGTAHTVAQCLLRQVPVRVLDIGEESDPG